MVSTCKPGWTTRSSGILVLIGATPEGKKELIGFTDGARESAQDWRELLLDLKSRGLAAPPSLAVGGRRTMADNR
jgi:transposase-like protein